MMSDVGHGTAVSAIGLGTPSGVDYMTMTAGEVADFAKCYPDKWPAERMHCSSGAFKWRWSVPATLLKSSKSHRSHVSSLKADDFEPCPYSVGQVLYINEPCTIGAVFDASFILVRSDGTGKTVWDADALKTAREAYRSAMENLRPERDADNKIVVRWPGVLPKKLAALDRIVVKEIGKPQLISQMTAADFEAEAARASNRDWEAEATKRIGWLQEIFQPKFPALASAGDAWVWPIYGMRTVV